MAFIDHAHFNFEGEKVFAVEYPQKNLSSNTQLTVKQGQEAIFILGGGDSQNTKVYGPSGSNYTLDTANLPGVRKLFGIPFGGSNPFLASVWFINKVDVTDITIKTNSFLIEDPSYAKGCPVVAEVDLSVRVVEGRVFLERLARYKSGFNDQDMTNALKGKIITEVSSKVAQLADASKLTVANITAHLSRMSRELEGCITAYFADFGIEFTMCNIRRVATDTSDEGLQMASGYGADLATADRMRMYKLQEKAIDSLSNGSGNPLGAILAMQMMGSMNSSGGGIGAAPAQGFTQQAQAPTRQNVQQAQQPNVKMVYCAGCGNKYDTNSSFCPKCGKSYHPCSQCASDNMTDAKRCVNCGAPFQQVLGNECPNCHGAVPIGSAFCPGCGRPMSEGKCLKCGTALNGAKFCPSCGTKNN